METYDRVKEVKEFDDSKIGVKGLIDSGITSIPLMFIHSQKPPPPSTPTPTTNPNSPQIPTVDLSQPGPTVVDQVRRASREWGFFQITNHGIPVDVLRRTINSIKAFHEEPVEVKSRYYTREMARGVAFSTNFDLYQTKAASWRDTLQVKLGDPPINYDLLPDACRSEVSAWDRHVMKLGDQLFGILGQGLGLGENRLKDLRFMGSRVMVGHYYPYCPQFDQTAGITPHTDPVALTILLQDMIGGLQVKHGEDWVDVRPLDGALVINIGDILQLVSNGEYKSVEHRVLANPNSEPRISVGVFLNPGKRDELYGPLDELVSRENPAIYRQFTFKEAMEKLSTRGLDGISLVDHFKVEV